MSDKTLLFLQSLKIASQQTDLVEHELAKAIMFKHDRHVAALNLFIRNHNIKISKERMLNRMFELQDDGARFEENRLLQPYNGRAIDIHVSRLSRADFDAYYGRMFTR
jgi:hypothetical protein